MLRDLYLIILVALSPALAFGQNLTDVVVDDFEQETTEASVWVVNMPQRNASVALSSKDPAEGKRALELKYNFTGGGQYLGVNVPVKIKAKVHKLSLQVRGNNSSSHFGIYVLDAFGETHKYRGRKIDFDGWKEVEINLDGGHESWGGDKNGRINLPIRNIVLEVGSSGKAFEGTLGFDQLTVASEGSAAETLGCEVSVTSPAYCADISGDTVVKVNGWGYSSLTVRCWQQGSGDELRFGKDSTVATVKLDAEGNGSFVFPASKYPHGPVTLTISGSNEQTSDNCYLQLYNKSGVSWNEGVPAQAPPAAEGMKLVYEDDFDESLSIGNGPSYRYYDHKPLKGQTDFSFPMRFADHNGPNSPFEQMGTYLRIRADEATKSAGLISSLHNDGSGFKVKMPAYFECRFIGPNATGTWPAFWIMTDHTSPGAPKGSDEMDIIEAYGGEGVGSPNAKDKYMIAVHSWAQGDEATARAKKASNSFKKPIEMTEAGIPSTWYESPHIYGCLVTETDTIYYCDDIEVARHETLPMTKQEPLFFFVNLATGGGWPVDLSRYDGKADMYVDYVRVYAK